MRRSLSLLVLSIGLLAAPSLEAQEPNFGRAVVMSGADLVIGQPVNWYGPGTVYHYRPGEDGAWVERALLTAPDSARMDDFGRALALQGNTLAVAAPRKGDGAGAVYVFTRVSADGGWAFDTKLEVPGDADAAELGAALALADGELLVGAPGSDGTGVVHRFVRQADGWMVAGTIRPAADSAVAGFGESLSWQGDRLLVGAPAADSARGRVYSVARSGDGDWGEPTAVELDRDALGERAAAGTAVLLDEGRAFVGAPGAGAVLVLETDAAGSWSHGGTLRPSDDEVQRSDFGSSLLRTGDELWVGAPRAVGDGLVYRLVSDGAGGGAGGWRHAEPIDADAPGDSWPLRFGHAMAAADGTAVISMPYRDFGEGRALTLHSAPAGWVHGQTLEGRIHRIGEDLATGDRCRDGELGEFPCANMEVVAHVPISELGAERGAWVNDVWGWTDPDTGHRYALVARRDGASFLDVTDPARPRLVGNLPRTKGSRPSVWRDIKVIDEHAYIVSDGAGAHGVQVFDLTRLRGVEAPADFAPDTTYHEIFSAHNIVADTASKFLYVVGANSGGQTCGGGLHMIDATDPERLEFAGCHHDATNAASRGYTHDAQCLVYEGPDEEHRGRQICVGSNEKEINIADVTDKDAPRTLGRASYPSVSYAHQGWFDDQQRYFYMNDEGDEVAGVTDRTRTIVWDLTDLDDPVVANMYYGPVPASDHNLYVVGDRMYQSNYGSGLRVLDIGDRENPREIGFFDSAPYNDDEPGFSATQSGAWSNYPFFEDDLVIFTSVREGLFIMRVVPPPVT